MKRTRIFIFLALILFFMCHILYSQESYANIKSAKTYGNSLIYTNSNYSCIYKLENNSRIKLAEGRGSGLYYTLNEKSNLLGFKIIDENGKQTPYLFNLTNNKSMKLSEPKDQCGQVHINNLGSYCFSLGKEIKVYLSNGKDYSLNLGSYSNITRLSNDNNYITFNDIEDQIWLLNTTSNFREKISTGNRGFFNPIFSNSDNFLLYQALNGEILIYDINLKSTKNIGVGFSPTWANNTDKIIYYTKQVLENEVINTEIEEYDCKSGMKNKLTGSPNVIEIDPSYNFDDSKIVYCTSNSNVIFTANFVDDKLNVIDEMKVYNEDLENDFKEFDTPNTIEAINIPYVHQVYDVPDWHNGHSSCAPTAAIMLLAHYKILPHWAASCSSPYSHINNYGRYVCERYNYRQIDYNFTATDAGGNATKGGFGFMWSSGSPYSKMADYYRYHGVAATQTEAPPHSEASTEITNGYPYTMCVGLTSAGHLVLAHGLGTEPHTLIVNDPYGNKNTPGYPSYDGQNAKYDWPGYNNGYNNLNQVYWCIKTKYNFIPVISDTLIDDVNYFNGFYMFNNPPSSMLNWYDRKSGGFKDHFWYVSSNNSIYTDKAYATWKPNLPKSGMYDVQVYIPYSTAKNAIYKVYTNEGLKVVYLNQSAHTSNWVSLGVFPFNAGNTGYLRLGDATDTSGVQIVFDAVRWVYKDSIQVSVEDDFNISTSFEISQNYPNPFNPSTVINYTIPTSGNLRIQIFNELGELIKVVKEDFVQIGNYTEQINMDGYPSGHLFINFVFQDSQTNYTTSKTIKALLIK